MHWHKLEWVDPKYLTKRNKPYSVYSKKIYLNKNDRTYHWIGYSKLKVLDINGFLKIKNMNEAMESELTEMYSRTYNLAVTEEANVDEDIPIYIKNNKAHKNIEKQLATILITLTLLKLEPK